MLFSHYSYIKASLKHVMNENSQAQQSRRHEDYRFARDQRQLCSARLQIEIYPPHNIITMIQIATVPYYKIYRFPACSDSMALVCILYLLALLLPFFMVYSVHNFYLSFADTVTSSPAITYDYHYHLTIQTSASAYVYSTLYKQSTSHPIKLSYEYQDDELTHDFKVEWGKAASEKVKNVEMIVFMKYSTAEIADGYGMIVANAVGTDIADSSMIGTMSIVNGWNSQAPPPTSNIIATHSYDVASTLESLKKDYSAYLAFSTNYLATNMPNDMLSISLRLRSNSHSFQQTKPSVLGQLVWSFAQYFPVALLFWLLAEEVLSYVFRNNLMKRLLIHETRATL